MQEEFESLKANDTWELVPRTTDRDIIDTRWVFRIKRNLDQSIEKYKDRFVVQGFTQIPGVDYDEVYSPMVSYTANRILIALATKYDLTIHQIDVKSVFLNGEVDTELYVEQPEIFEEKDRKLWVCKLKKGLYGLKQAPRLWHRTLQSHLLSIGFIQLESEPSIFIKKLEDTFIVIAAYVDDLQIALNDVKVIQNIKLELQNKFQMTDLEKVNHILGLRVLKTEDHISIDQAHYVENILKKFGIDQCYSVSTPIEIRIKLLPLQENEEVINHAEYRSIVRALNYLVIVIRLNITFATRIVARFM